jgi:hypothetical protein
MDSERVTITVQSDAAAAVLDPWSTRGDAGE